MLRLLIFLNFLFSCLLGENRRHLNSYLSNVHSDLLGNLRVLN